MTRQIHPHRISLLKMLLTGAFLSASILSFGSSDAVWANSNNANPENSSSNNVNPNNANPENSSSGNVNPNNTNPENSSSGNVNPNNTNPENSSSGNVNPNNVNPSQTNPNNTNPNNTNSNNTNSKNTSSNQKKSPNNTIATAIATLKKSDQRWIQIDLSKQNLIAWEGNKPVYAVTISSGKRSTPTRIGTFKIKTKHKTSRMRGPGYDVPNVPHTMYYQGGYAIHGAYWHKRFGTPVSHGCINLAPNHAKWVFEWADVGTPVVIKQ